MLGKLLAAFGTAAIRGEIASTVNRIRLRAVLTAGAAVMWLLAVGFTLAAFGAWLATLVGPIFACLILAVAFGLVAIGLQVAMTMMKGRGTPLTQVLSQAIAPLKQAADESAGAAPAAGNDGAPTPAGEAASAGAILFLAAIGYVLGRNVTGR